MKTICYYHADMDGIASAAIVRKKYPDCELVKVQYGDNIDVEKYKGKHLILVDFSFPKDLMKDIVNICNEKLIMDFTWIDHHKSAMEENKEIWDSNIEGKREIGKAACELTWEYYFPDEKMPQAIRLVGDRDLWKFKYSDTETFNEYAYLMVDYPTSEFWERLLSNTIKAKTTIEVFCKRGHLLLFAKQKRVVKAFDNGQDGVFEDHRCRTVNTNHDISDVGNYIVESGYPLAVVFSNRKDKLIVSLYSNDIDVSEIAKKYGGGGHKEASGFEIEFNIFKEALTNETRNLI